MEKLICKSPTCGDHTDHSTGEGRCEAKYKEPTTETFLKSIRVETLKNEITRFKKRIERNEKEIERLTNEAYEIHHTNFGPIYTRRLFDSEGRRLKV